jgi:hypothetical protein
MEVESILKEIQILMSSEKTKIRKHKDSCFLEYKKMDIDKSNFLFKQCHELSQKYHVAILLEMDSKREDLRTVKIYKGGN